eukprot:COSAG02_NODE_20680_length_819_cov_3.256944_1_plen_155_part_00
MAAEIAKAAGLNTSTKTVHDTASPVSDLKSPPLGTMPKLAPIEAARKIPKAKPRSAITKPRITKVSSLASAFQRVDEFGEPLCVLSGRAREIASTKLRLERCGHALRDVVLKSYGATKGSDPSKEKELSGTVSPSCRCSAVWTPDVAAAQCLHT